MAALLIRTCLKRSLSKSFLSETLVYDRSIILNIGFIDIPILLQCSCYHSTPILLKRRKTREEKKKLVVAKELSLLDKKKKNKLPVIDVWKNMSVKDLAVSSGRTVDNVLEALFYVNGTKNYEDNAIFQDPNILFETVKKLGSKFRIVPIPSNEKEEDHDVYKRPPPDPEVLIKRRPIITIMGHVDHGKTTLLDSLRNSAVVESEFGGITQHIGAFNVTLDSGEKITFLDTPGHAAFTIMRARGASVTDIVILVVAADDGVMEQTVQSINMAKEANVPMIVAINKIDKPGVKIERTHHMLAEHGINVEALGGDVQSVNISALKGTNLDQLMEAVLAQAEIMDLKGDPTGLVEGVVIEASTDPHRGKLATALIQRGTLRKGDILVSGLAWAKVRSMFDHAGTIISEASLSNAVQIIGWRDLPVAGDDILEVESEKKAHLVMKYRHAKQGQEKSIEQKIVADKKHEDHLVEYRKFVQEKRRLGLRKPKRAPIKEIKEDDHPKVNIIIKGDVVGSIEAIMDVLDTYTEDNRCRLSVVNYGVGSVNETDLEFAKTFNAIIYCFNTTVPQNLSQEIIKENISVRHHNVIYKLIDDLKAEINKNLPMVTEEEEIGEAEILKEFEINVKRRKVKVAGCRCVKGTLKKSELFKVLRNEEVIYRGKANEFRHLKEEVDTITANMECGIKLEKAEVDLKPGDKLICYRLVDKYLETEWNTGF